MVDIKMATPRLADDSRVKDVGSASRCLVDIYLKDGREYMGQQDYKNALISYNKALEIESRDSTALVARSWCYLKMGKRQKALRDAETVMDCDVMNTEALHAKAEVLFQNGNFELSLIYFHRGLKQSPMNKEFLAGVKKSQEGVLKFGGSNRGLRMSTAGDLSLYMHKKHSSKGNGDSEMSPRADIAPPQSDRTHDRLRNTAPDDFRSTVYCPLTRISKKPGLSHFRSVTGHSEKCSSEISHMTGTQPTDSVAQKQILGQLYTDKKYLQSLYQSVDMSMENKGSISDLAESGINFLQERSAYWDKLGPLPPPQPNRRAYQRKHGTTSGAPTSVKSLTTIPASGPTTESRVDAPPSVQHVSFSFASHEQDEENSVAMDTDSHGGGPSENLSLASDATMTSLEDSTREATKRERNLYFAQELEAIEKLYNKGKFTDCSDRAEACLTEVQAVNEREITEKFDVLATLHSYIGNAAAARGQYSKAKFHHTKDLEIGEFDDMPEVSSRALGNLGRMYCSQRKYNKALDVLTRKAPLCSTPREVSWVFLEIGMCFMALGYHDYASDCGKKVLSVARPSDLQDELFQAQLLVASAEEKMKKYEKASSFYSTALDTAIIRGDKMAEYAIRNAMRMIEKKLAFMKPRPGQGKTTPRKQVPTDKKENISHLAPNVERQFESTGVVNQDTDQTNALPDISDATVTEPDSTEPEASKDAFTELHGTVKREFEGVTILSVLQKLREEYNSSSTNTISEYQESEADKMDDSTSDLDQTDNPLVKHRPSMKKRGSFMRRRSKSLLGRRISFKQWDEKGNLFEHSEEGLYPLEEDGLSTGRTLSKRERAALTIQEQAMRIRYKRMDTDWIPRDINLAKYSGDELEEETSISERLDGNVIAAALAESGYLKLINMVGSKFDFGGCFPNTDVDNYTLDREESSELQTNCINDDVKIIPSDLTEESELFEEDPGEGQNQPPIFLYPPESESFSCPFDSEFVVDEEDVMVVSTSGVIREDHEPTAKIPRRLSVVFEDVTEEVKEPPEPLCIIIDQENMLGADTNDLTRPSETILSLDLPEKNKPKLKPTDAATRTASEPSVSEKGGEVVLAPKNTPRSKTSNKSIESRDIPQNGTKVSNRNKDVHIETNSDTKELSTPRKTKPIHTKSKASNGNKDVHIETNSDTKEVSTPIRTKPIHTESKASNRNKDVHIETSSDTKEVSTLRKTKPIHTESKASNGNKDVHIETNSDTKEVSTPRKTKPIHTESKASNGNKDVHTETSSDTKELSTLRKTKPIHTESKASNGNKDVHIETNTDTKEVSTPRKTKPIHTESKASNGNKDVHIETNSDIKELSTPIRTKPIHTESKASNGNKDVHTETSSDTKELSTPRKTKPIHTKSKASNGNKDVHTETNSDIKELSTPIRTKPIHTESKASNRNKDVHIKTNTDTKEVSTPRKTKPIHTESKASNGNKDVHIETNSDIKELSTPIRTKPIHTESKASNGNKDVHTETSSDTKELSTPRKTKPIHTKSKASNGNKDVHTETNSDIKELSTPIRTKPIHTESKASNRNKDVHIKTNSDTKELSTPRKTKPIHTESKASNGNKDVHIETNSDTKELSTPRKTKLIHTESKASNGNKDVHTETSSDTKELSTPIRTKPIHTESKTITPVAKQTPVDQGPKETTREHTTNIKPNFAKGENGTEKKDTKPGISSVGLVEHKSQLQPDQGTAKHTVTEQRSETLKHEQKSPQQTNSLGDTKLEYETSVVMNKDEQVSKSGNKEGEDTADAAETPVVLSFGQRLKSFLGILSLRKPQSQPKTQEAEKDIHPGDMPVALREEMKHDEETANGGSKELQEESQKRTINTKLLPVLKDSPYTKVVKSSRMNTKEPLVTVKAKSRQPGITDWKGSSVPLTQTARNTDHTEVSKSQATDADQSVPESEDSTSDVMQRTDVNRPQIGEESSGNAIKRSEIPPFIKKKNLLYKLTDKEGQILFTPMEPTEPNNKWKVVYMRVRKGERNFTIPVIQEPADKEKGSCETSGETSIETVKATQKLYPMRIQSKKQFRKSMATNLGGVPEDKESNIDSKTRKSPEKPKPAVIPIPDDKDRYSSSKIDINYIATMCEGKKGSDGERMSVSGDNTESDTGVKLRVRQGQEVVYRQTDRNGKVVLVPVVKTPAHKVVLVKVKRKNEAFVIPVIVDKTK